MKPKYFLFTFTLLLGAATSASGQPAITVQPKNQTASLFADVTFRLTVTGGAPYGYQWRFNEADLIGLTNATLTMTNVQRTNAGNYSVVVSNLSGSITSQVATLTITPFNSIYSFGYSWTDTHNCDWASPQYYNRHACNGPMWPEFLSTNLGLAYVEANNFAVCGAGGAEVLNQVQNFPAPPKPKLSLYFLMFSDDILWGFPPNGAGGVYINVTNGAAWDQVIQTGILNNSNAVNRLYARGARAIVAQSEIDFSKAPRALSAFGTNTAGLSKLGEYCTRYNTGFFDAMNAYRQTKPDLRIIWVDLFSKLNDVLANPVQYGFTKTDIDALGDTNLTNKAFSGPGADYVFWDGLHGTSKLNELIAGWNLEALTNSILEKLQLTIASGSAVIQMNHLLIGRDYTLQTSSNLTTWSDVQSFTAADGTNQWSAPPATSDGRYYRLKWQP